MEWVLRSPQIHSTFSNLGFSNADGYHVNENCNAALESILQNILTEDKYLLSYRRSISFGQNIKKDLIPLLINAKGEKTVELIVKILLNLTIPIECLLSVDTISKSDFGRHTIFEINNLLSSTKVSFTDNRATRVVIEFLKKNIDVEPPTKLSLGQCSNVTNSLLLLRNILHIPEDTISPSPSNNGSTHSVQNQILWNIFSQSIDKLLIKLMTIPDASKWGVTMVQLIALLYKDQHAVVLHKLLNLWLEASLSDSSEDNESNTSPLDRAGSDDSSPMLTSDPTSDSSDTGGSGKINGEPNKEWDPSGENNTSQSDSPQIQNNEQHNNKEDIKPCGSQNTKTVKYHNNMSSCNTSGVQSEMSVQSQNKTVKSETSDCGYGTQIENQESISTSSNEDDLPSKKPVHQKPHNPKQRINTNKQRTGATPQERKRKKIVKRGKSNIINVQGLSHKTPTDDDISNVLKEFTVDFLLKGYKYLVKTLHNEILTNHQLEIDKSHFFWLVTYFLKFATQIELDLDHVSTVLSYDILSYLTAEGVNLCEHFELSIKLGGSDLTPNIRRLHLVVTAIREFVQAIEVYKKFTHINNEDREGLIRLQFKMCEAEELRSLMVFLLRHYNPKYHTKQYLQDLIVTNHILLMFLDNTAKMPGYNCTTNMVDHLKQFASPKIMYQYGIMLEDYSINGEFVNDCIFTLMHHVGGELGSVITLFHPKILKTFSAMCKSDFEMCDDWSDLIEYVINTFIKRPQSLLSNADSCLRPENFDEDKTSSMPAVAPSVIVNIDETDIKRNGSTISVEKWTEDELSSLSWTFMQCNTSSDLVGDIIKLLREDGVTKPRDSIVNQLFKQNIIGKEEFDKLTKTESDRNARTMQVDNEMRDDEIRKLCKELAQDGKSKFLDWVQHVLLETCYAKLHFEKLSNEKNNDDKFQNFQCFKTKSDVRPPMSPVSYHSLLANKSVPLVPWNCQQASVCKDLKFLQLLHKLGFYMPVDSGKLFIRIPHFWTADFLYEIAGKISIIDTSKLKFSADELSVRNIPKIINPQDMTFFTKGVTIIETPENYYQKYKQKNFATMVNFTPTPGTSFHTESEVEKYNWLKVVQKSQEYKITLNLDKLAAVSDDGLNDIEMVPVEEELELAPATDAAALTAQLAAPAVLLPTVITVQQDTTIYNVQVAEPECNNSVCETASVASDLTRMYVSDEDEKPEVLPVRLPIIDNLDLDHSNCPGKRPRISF